MSTYLVDASLDMPVDRGDELLVSVSPVDHSGGRWARMAVILGAHGSVRFYVPSCSRVVDTVSERLTSLISAEGVTAARDELSSPESWASLVAGSDEAPDSPATSVWGDRAPAERSYLDPDIDPGVSSGATQRHLELPMPDAWRSWDDRYRLCTRTPTARSVCVAPTQDPLTVPFAALPGEEVTLYVGDILVSVDESVRADLYTFTTSDDAVDYAATLGPAADDLDPERVPPSAAIEDVVVDVVPLQG